MANPAEAVQTIIVAKRTILEQRLATAIEEKMKRSGNAGQDFDAPLLWLTIETNNTTNARVGFHVGNDDAGPPSSELIEVDLRILKQLAEAAIEPTVANHVCDAVLSFRTGGHPAAEEDPNLLTTIRNNIRPNAFKLHLTEEQIFSTGSVRTLASIIRAGYLRELELLSICGSDIETIGGNDVIQEVLKPIAHNHQARCPKLRTLILNFDYPIDEHGSDTIQQLLKHVELDGLAQTTMTIVVPKAQLTIENPGGNSERNQHQVGKAIWKLARAVWNSGLKCLKLNWRAKNCDVTRSQLDNILQGLCQRPPATMVNELKIEKPTPDSNTAVDAEGNVETVRHIVWKNAEGPIEQRIELTLRGPKEDEGETEEESEDESGEDTGAESGEESEDETGEETEEESEVEG